MKPLHLIFTATLATGVSLGALTLGCAYAAENAPNKTDPGFVPSTGQINPGTPRTQDSHSQAVAAEREKKIPTMKEATAAFHSPTPKGPAIGHMPSPPQPAQSSETAQSANAIGGPAQPTAPGSPTSGGAGHGAQAAGAPGGSSQGGQNSQPGAQQNGQAAQQGMQQNATGVSAATTGKGEASPAHETAPSEWPVGSLNQTAPAKFSERNDTLDRYPIMGWFTLSLNDDERQRIFEAVMGEKSAASADADKLKVSSQVTTQQALNEMKPLPKSLGIAHVQTLDYIKAKDKVLLVEPATRVVVGELTK